MRRRRALAGLALISASWAERRALAKGPIVSFRSSVFFVAGVRFQHISGPVATGDAISIIEEPFGDGVSYAIHHYRAGRLGYVPRSVATQCSLSGLHSVLLTESNPYAVPWRRFKVRVEFVEPAAPSRG